MPNTNTELEDIQDLNLTYLLLAQNLLRKDREIAIFRLKLSEQMADLLTKLSSKQMTQLARVNQLICRPVFEETERLSKVLGNARELGMVEIHSALLMAAADRTGDLRIGEG
ncbi:flagellar transcriptional regulator FlhD [Pseudomonas kairouanensis]|uniref:Flagellar transcriptional regulator FlhD n=1 Tax=Pseudomonas kairouanensis TaxID=2293832 RepID=A0A4Z0AQG4_9PSED|nr:flagellar transcriptional regulator FlhD [Pseudomonas kairouanensis]TFY88607.1 flagellar transcriptional regulator FlhD [Pseudomonas kairouanensis]